MVAKRILMTPNYEIVNGSHLYVIHLAEKNKLRNNFVHNFPGIYE